MSAGRAGEGAGVSAPGRIGRTCWTRLRNKVGASLGSGKAPSKDSQILWISLAIEGLS